MYWKELGLAHKIKERLDSEQDLQETSVAGSVNHLPRSCHYVNSSHWFYKTSSFKFWKRDQLALLQSGVYPSTNPSHIVRFSLWLPTPLFGDIPSEGRCVVNWGATTLVGVLYNGCFPPCPKEISNKQYKEKLLKTLSEAITLSSGKKLQDQRGGKSPTCNFLVFMMLSFFTCLPSILSFVI